MSVAARSLLKGGLKACVQDTTANYVYFVGLGAFKLSFETKSIWSSTEEG